jgi:predicted SAM-dependent methyltransferase
VGVFSEHCLEHVTLAAAKALLREVHRILQPGGVVRLAVPDAELYIDLYNQCKRGVDVTLPYATKSSKECGYGPLAALNRVFREHGHVYCYDFEELARSLTEAGFVKVARAAYREGRLPGLLVDSECRMPESLYVEAEKSEA